jgi:hypothetical protein
VQLCSAISQEAKGGSPWLSVSREEAVDFIFSIEKCLTHAVATNQSKQIVGKGCNAVALLLLHDNISG